MIEIEFRPPKKLVILECSQYPTIKALSETIATAIRIGARGVLNWAEGVVFLYEPLPPDTEDLMKDRLRGQVYWSNVAYALMPDYKSTIKVGTLDIPVIDVSPLPIMREVASWLKEHSKKSNKT